ncbi:hypothetical protein ACEPAF_9474 [Sanghuangporus sanghuang]
MLRYSSAYPDEAMSVNTGTSSNMRTIPPVYFRPSSPSSPLRSKASTFAMPHMPIPVQLQVPSVRSSASSAASNRSSKSFDGENEKEVIIEREREKGRERERVGEREERKVPMAPAMRRGESSSTSSSSGSSRGYGGSASYFYRQEPAPQLHRRASTTTATATAPSTPTTTPPSSSSSSRTRSRRQSINQAGSSPYPAPASASRRRNPGEEAATRGHNNINININNYYSNGYDHPDSIPHLREALSSLESQMASLEFEKQRLETKLENAVRQQVPVHRLPRELLGAIFEIGVHSADAEDAVLLSTLMRVCKTWTDVALNTPVLWSRILIDSPASLPKARRKLARSRAVPLDITIQFSPSVDPEAAVPMPLRGGGGQVGSGKAIIETVVHAMDLLQPALWRWRSFRLAVPTHAHAAAALSQCTDAAPLLEVLAVQVHHVMHDSVGVSRSASSSSRSRRHAPLSLNAFMDEDAGAQLFGGHTPRLRKCALTSFDAGWGGPLMQGLTVLRLGGFWNGAAPGARTLVDVLRACPTLEELALRNMSDVEGEIVGSTNESSACYDFDGSSKSSRSHSHSHSHSHHVHAHAHAHSHTAYPRESEMVHLPRLKSASFYYSGQLRTTALLAHMSFPALERLEFAYLDNLTPAFAHLKRQACSIPAEWERDEVEVPVPGRRTSRGRMSGSGSGSWTGQEEMGMTFRTGLPLKALRIESCLFNELKLVRLLRRFPTLRSLELVDVEDVSASFLNGLSTPTSQHTNMNANEWICPLLDTLSFDGCSALSWDALRALVEARLPVADSASARLLGPASARSRTKGVYSISSSGAGNGSSASGYAAQQQQQQQHSSSAAASSRVSRTSSGAASLKDGLGLGLGLELPRRIRVVDLTRCPQISKEMIAWLRMYVSEVRVRREAEQTYWGEGGFAV